MTGFATSVIGCKCEAGIERELAPDETPDGRPGMSVLLLTMAKDDLPVRLIERIGQTVLTCPTTACFDGLPEAPDRVGVGSALRLFGDGFQGSKMMGGRRFWRIPVMEGEFLVEEKFGLQKGIGGGNFLILATSADSALAAAEAAVDAMAGLPGVILPFPGGVVRSGSKVGSRRTKGMIASTNDAYCPTLRAVTATALPESVNSVLEIVLDGVDAPAISRAMRVGDRCRVPRRRRRNHGRQLRRQARAAPLPPASDHGRRRTGAVSGETTLTLRRALAQRVDASTVAWDALRGLDAAGIEAQEVWIEGSGRASAGRSLRGDRRSGRAGPPGRRPRPH